MEPTPYQETQSGVLLLAVLGAVAVIEVKFGVPLQPSWLMLAIVVAIMLLAIAFSSMTIRVSGSGVEWWLGLPLLKQRVAIADIASVDVGRVGWFAGLGIRTNGRTITWMVTGRSVVILTLHDGRRAQLGSNEPERVVEAIREVTSAK